MGQNQNFTQPFLNGPPPKTFSFEISIHPLPMLLSLSSPSPSPFPLPLPLPLLSLSLSSLFPSICSTYPLPSLLPLHSLSLVLSLFLYLYVSLVLSRSFSFVSSIFFPPVKKKSLPIKWILIRFFFSETITRFFPSFNGRRKAGQERQGMLRNADIRFKNR